MLELMKINNRLKETFSINDIDERNTALETLQRIFIATSLKVNFDLSDDSIDELFKKLFSSRFAEVMLAEVKLLEILSQRTDTKFGEAIKAAVTIKRLWNKSKCSIYHPDVLSHWLYLASDECALNYKNIKFDVDDVFINFDMNLRDYELYIDSTIEFVLAIFNPYHAIWGNNPEVSFDEYVERLNNPSDYDSKIHYGYLTQFKRHPVINESTVPKEFIKTWLDKLGIKFTEDKPKLIIELSKHFTKESKFGKGLLEIDNPDEALAIFDESNWTSNYVHACIVLKNMMMPS